VALLALLGGCATAPTFDDARALEAQGRLVEALQSYEKALPALAGTDRASVQANVDRLRRAITDAALAEARRLAESGTLPDMRRALDALQANQPHGDGRHAGEVRAYEQRLAGLQRDFDDAVAQGDAAAARGDWLPALEALARAEKIGGTAVNLAGKRATWLARRDEQTVATIRAAVAARELPEAEALVRRFAASVPAPAPELVARLEREVTQLRQTLFLEAQQALVAQKDFLTAYRNLLGAGFPEARAYQETVRRDGSRHYLDLARSELAKDITRLGYAYFASAKAKELNGDQEDVFRFHRDISDMIENLITVRIAISGFDSPAAVPGVGNQVSDALIAYLVDRLPHGIQILERSKIDQLLSERGRELKELSDNLKVEMFIIGNVSTLDIERQRTEREVAEIVKTGVRKEPNPIYAQMAAKFGPETGKWPSQPPAFIDGAPITETVRYKQGEEALNGIMVSSVRIFEASKGAISVAREFRVVESLKDGFRDAVPIAQIAYDALDLPADNEVRERLREGMVKKIAEVVLSTYVERERRYLTAAQSYLDRREREKAVLELACGHHYSVVATKDIKGGRANPNVAAIDRLGLFELTR
jgi:hypothetical protein